MDIALRRCVQLIEELDNPFQRATVGLFVGQVELMRGQISTAVKQFEEILVLARGNGDRVTESGALNYLGWTLLLTGDPIAARASFRETLLLTTATGNEWGTAYALEGLGAVAATMGDLPFAGRMFGAAEAIREQKSVFAVSTYAFAEPILERIEDGPGADRFEEARQAGGTAELADMVALALS